MSENQLKKFFSKIAVDINLQKRLFITKELTDVSTIANEYGFDVKAADILRAQAGKILLMPIRDQEDVASGKKGKTGAQWGRTGRGYLDNVGYWLMQIIKWECDGPAGLPQLEVFFSKISTDEFLQTDLLTSKTFNDVASVADKHGCEIYALDLLKYQAIQILKLSDEKAEVVARGEV